MLNGQWLIFLREVEHVEDDRLVTSVLAVMNALFVGLLFGWLYYKTRSLLLTISLHLVNNSLYSITLLTPLKDVQYAQMNTWVIVPSIVILIALSVISFKWLHAKFLYSPTP